MPNLINYTLDDIVGLQARIHAGLSGCASLQEAAERCVSAVYEDHERSLALVRLYATIPFGRLPPAEKSFAARLAESNGVSATLKDDTPVLSLLGTRGDAPEWNDRRRSKGHLGIPLVASGFVEAIPMVAQLMQDMGIGLGWLDTKDTRIVVKTLGRIAGVFYVRAAADGVDGKGRKIVPAQEFVEACGVETVFGLGGSYLDGTCVVLILFTRETMEREEVEKFMPLVNTIKTLTMSLVMGGKFFA